MIGSVWMTVLSLQQSTSVALKTAEGSTTDLATEIENIVKEKMVSVCGSHRAWFLPWYFSACALYRVLSCLPPTHPLHGALVDTLQELLYIHNTALFYFCLGHRTSWFLTLSRYCVYFMLGFDFTITTVHGSGQELTLGIFFQGILVTSS